ncbi:hypothetical protein [Natronorubrum sp. FCH18a]|uniref:hypothetical protein n=1 Tax=Natronorubrum sp. FCH18a TaxID=3447018 RepID=UPI003F51703F
MSAVSTARGMRRDPSAATRARSGRPVDRHAGRLSHGIRLRHLEPGPDGSLYLLTSNRRGRAGGEFPLEDVDRIVRLDPS